MRLPSRMVRPPRPAVCFAALVLSTTLGCGGRAEITLRQSFAPPSQREMKLVGRSSYFTQTSDRLNCVLTFARPGASEGSPDFLLYLTAPAGAGGGVVRDEGPDGVHGFLIQAVGDLKGKTMFSSGTVRVRPLWFSPSARRLDLSVACDDGTWIAGRAQVVRLEREVRKFERRYAADVALLASPSCREASPPPTERRMTGAP